jgi:uncharacterized membrane protein
MSLETGRTLGLISTIMFVILPIVGGVLFVSLFSIILSAIGAGLSQGNLPSNFPSLAAGLAGLGIGFIAVGILGLIFGILFVVSMYVLSKYYNEPAIFRNILYAIIILIVGAVVAVVFELLLIIPISRTVAQSPGTPSFSSLPIFGFIAVLIAAVILGIISAVLVMRAFNKLAEKSEVDNFKTAGLLYLIGVLTSFIFIGGIIVWIGFIFAAMGFYRLKPIKPISYETPIPQTMLPTKRCPYCSTENVVGATYCRFCGKPLQ